jgi:hypothetical protein
VIGLRRRRSKEALTEATAEDNLPVRSTRYLSQRRQPPWLDAEAAVLRGPSRVSLELAWFSAAEVLSITNCVTELRNYSPLRLDLAKRARATPYSARPLTLAVQSEAISSGTLQYPTDLALASFITRLDAISSNYERVGFICVDSEHK